MFIFCVKAALLAKRAFVACFASWFSEWYTMRARVNKGEGGKLSCVGSNPSYGI